MARYSETPLARKLGIKPGNVVGVFAGPDNLIGLLEPLPKGASVVREPEHRCDVLIVFAPSFPALVDNFKRALRLLPKDGGVWLTWPKKGSAKNTDLAFDTVQQVGLESGLVDNKVCAIDETWSALRFVVRREGRADWPANRPA